MNTVKTKLLLLLCLCAGTYTTYAQTSLFAPSSSVGSSTTSGVGVFTSAPLGGYFDVNGDVRVNGSGINDGTYFASPNGEKGLSIVKGGVSNRADLRFDGTTFKMVVGSGTSVPDPTNGLSILTNGNAAIGTVPNNAAKLTVVGVLPPGGGSLNTGLASFMASLSTSGTTIGLSSEAQGGAFARAAGFNATGADDVTGLKATAYGNATGASISVGGEFTSTNSINCYGLKVDAGAGSSVSPLVSVGIQVTAQGAQENIGIRSTVSGGIGVGPMSYAGRFTGTGIKARAALFVGDVDVEGNVVPTSNCSYNLGSPLLPWYSLYICRAPLITSDARLKDNIKDLEYGLKEINQLRPVSYNLYNDNDRSLGLIAQETKEVINEIVHVDNGTEKRMGIRYTELIPVLIKAIQEQQEMITSRNGLIDELKIRIEQLEAGRENNTGINTKNGNTDATLFQNNPNPFNGTTEIRYRIPDTYTTASVMIFDMNGKKIKELPIHGSEGGITLSATDMTAGMYLYSLLIDGREIATNRMVVNK